jgi:hypothetical protein
LINIQAHQTELVSNPEFEKLSTLNHLLGNGDQSENTKIMLIYHQILEELHEGCCRNQNLMIQEESIEKTNKVN